MYRSCWGEVSVGLDAECSGAAHLADVFLLVITTEVTVCFGVSTVANESG